ncbi:MAG: pectin acetylesterase-family hydrolase, partial [Myxococcota bacterium]
GDDAAPDATGSLFDGRPGQWHWLEVPEAECLDGTSTGLAYNRGTGDGLLILLPGGGVIFDALSVASWDVAFNEFGVAEFERERENVAGKGIVNRDNVKNPFHDWSYVYLPYCTADFFAGSTELGVFGFDQVGYRNVTEYLKLLVPAFADASQVVLAGSSGGGFGTVINYEQVQSAFGDTPVLLLSDSAPVPTDEYLMPCLQQKMRTAWLLEEALPPQCDQCSQTDGGGIIHLVDYLANSYPQGRFAFVVSQHDDDLRQIFGFGGGDQCNEFNPLAAETFAEAVRELRDDVHGTHESIRYYTIDSVQHVWLLEEPLDSVMVGDVRLTDWLGAFIEGSSSWTDVVPPAP